MNKKNFTVISAKNGKEGLDSAIQELPDIILLDIRMPVMDGLEFLKQLRAYSEWGNSVPVIILTNVSANDEVTNRVTLDHPSYYLIKSNFSLAQIMQKVEEVLGSTPDSSPPVVNA